MDELQTLDQYRQVLGQVTDIQTAMNMEGAAAVFVELVKRQKKELDEVNKAIEMLLWTRRKAGEILDKMPKNTGELFRGSMLEPRGEEQTYTEIGIDKKDAFRWKALASIPEEAFIERIEEIKQKGEPLTFNSFYTLAAKLAGKEVDERHPLTEDEVLAGLAKAMIFSAIDDHDKQFLTSNTYRFYIETLGVPQYEEFTKSWVQDGCLSIENSMKKCFETMLERRGQ